MFKRTPIILTLSTLLLAACSPPQLYATGRNAQRAGCAKQVDVTARDRCLKDAEMPHDVYQKESDAARK